MSIAPRNPKTQQTPATEPVTCSTCPFFVPRAGSQRYGQCRRLPPIAHPTEEFGMFADVDAEWFCGEHPMFKQLEAKRRKAEQD